MWVCHQLNMSSGQQPNLDVRNESAAAFTAERLWMVFMIKEVRESPRHRRSTGTQLKEK
jgi:hypothetical protein